MKTKYQSIFVALLACAIILAIGIGSTSSNHRRQIAAASSPSQDAPITIVATGITTAKTTAPVIVDSGPIKITTSNHIYSNLIINNADRYGQYGISIDANANTISNIVLENITINNPHGMGICLYEDSGPATIENIVIYHCTINDAGDDNTSENNGWIAGIDIAEGDSDLTVSNIYLIDCEVNGSLESCYHTEQAPTKNNVVFLDNDAQNSGQKPNYTFGYGYLISGDVIFYGNAVENCVGGDVHYYGVYLLPFGVYQGNNITRIAQGNCKGISMYDGSNYTVILYSTDGNPVSQTIIIGGNNHEVSFPYYFIQTY